MFQVSSNVYPERKRNLNKSEHYCFKLNSAWWGWMREGSEFESPYRSEQLWWQLGLLSNGYQEKLTIHFQLVPRSRKCRAIYSLQPCTFSA
jgi:hypothetical protein